jgi:hypothetical protein
MESRRCPSWLFEAVADKLSNFRVFSLGAVRCQPRLLASLHRTGLCAEVSSVSPWNRGYREAADSKLALASQGVVD